MTDPLEAAIELLDEARAGLGVEHVSDSARTSAQMKNDKRLVLVDWYLRAAAIKSATSAGWDHPPVPEQAATDEERLLIEESAELWRGWQPGAWPVPEGLGGFSWHVFGAR